MNLLEARIRDQLSTHLDLLEPNLQLVDYEYALNGDLGCNGFVNIIARDFFGNAVIIEIKRSDPTARTDSVTSPYTASAATCPSSNGSS